MKLNILKQNRIPKYATLVAVALTSAQFASAASVWTTGILEPTDGAFGTAGSISSGGTTINATIEGTTVQLVASNGTFFRDTSSPNITNNELAPFFENNTPLTTLTFTAASAGVSDFEILFHNFIYDSVGENFVGNFIVTYADGFVDTNASPTVANIGSTSPFTTGGTDTQPTGLHSAFNSSNILTAATVDPDGAGAATTATYLSDSEIDNPQGSGIVSFDETGGHGGITQVQMTWVGNTSGPNTAFIGFAGSAIVPEPSSTALLGLGGLALMLRRKRS